MKILEATCSHSQMEYSLGIPTQFAAIEASFIQLKPKLVKYLSSQLGGQHPSARKRVWCVVREEQPGHATLTTHTSCPNHSHSRRSSLLLGHRGAWGLVPWSQAVHVALCVSASHTSRSPASVLSVPAVFGAPLTAPAGWCHSAPALCASPLLMGTE